MSAGVYVLWGPGVVHGVFRTESAAMDFTRREMLNDGRFLSLDLCAIIGDGYESQPVIGDTGRTEPDYNR